MRALIKFGLLGVGLLFALACLNSCAVFTPALQLLVTATPDSGHPPFETTIVATCMTRQALAIYDSPVEGGMYTLAVVGEEPVESEGGVFAITIGDWPWAGAVTWTDSKGTILEVTVPLSLKNEIPIAHSLWTVPRAYDDKALILIDLRYLEHGCIGTTGKPESVSGFEDPDCTQDGYSMENDGFTYHVEVEDTATGDFESVFYGLDRVLLGDEFVEHPIFFWFVNWIEETPPYPYQPKSQLGKRVHVYVMEWGSIRHWFYDVTASESGCAYVMP